MMGKRNSGKNGECQIWAKTSVGRVKNGMGERTCVVR
jgi:hypothetical protein